MAKFLQIAERIASDIRQGQFGKPGDRFLTVRALAEQFSVSLMTAQKVVAHLRESAILVGDEHSPTTIGPGAFVARQGNEGSAAKRPIGLVVPEVTNPFFSRLGRYVQRTATKHGRHVLMAGSESPFEQEQKVIQGFLDFGVDGLLLCPGLDESCTAFYRELQVRGVPLVFVSRRPERVEADFVVAHNLVGGTAMAAHLVAMRYSTMGYIAFGPQLKRDGRLTGFRAELVEHGIDLPAKWLADGNGRGIEHGYRAMQRLMADRDRPRAVFAYNDLLAIGALQYCHDHGIAVPGDVAVAGFDNLPESRVTAPPLTTIAYPVETIAEMAVQCLIDRIEATEPFPTRRILLEPHLVVRGSTDPEVSTYRGHFPAKSDALGAEADTKTFE